MTATDLLIDGFERVQQIVHRVLDGASDEALTYRVDADANTIAWLTWHIARGQDAQIAPLTGGDQVWMRDGFADRFGLPFSHAASGYGQSSEEVASVTASAALLREHYDAVHAATIDFVRTLDDGDMERVVDPSWTPPVTMGVRLMSILNDDVQHAGQASFVRGITDRRGL